MQQIGTIASTHDVSSTAHIGRRYSRLWTALGLLTLLLLLALLPPLLSLSRYQRRIASSISLSLGRSVHLDHVALNLLPLPSLSIQNFVVDENAAFGEEPFVRAHAVIANLRVSSLWRRRIEISRIRFIDPSVNLVLRADGRWNLEDVFVQASRIDAAPTAQRGAGAAPRFPYIEATGARVNLKLGQVKTPFSLTEADFALWLPEPQQWRMRLKAKPIRTDTSVSDTGLLEAEVGLHRASSLGLVPLSLTAAWRNAPLGDASRILFGRDLGVRGTMNVLARSEGTLGDTTLSWKLGLAGAHRSDFVPAKPLQMEWDCTARARRLFHTLADLRCGWPIPDSRGATLAVTGSVPNLLEPRSAELQVGTGRLPASTLLDLLRVLSARIPPDLSADGTLSASLSHDPGTQLTAWSGEAILADPALNGASVRQESLSTDAIRLIATAITAPVNTRSPRLTHSARRQTTPEGTAIAPQISLSGVAIEQVALDPVYLSLGGPTDAVLEGHADRTGYVLHLSGPAVLSRLLALAGTIPPLGDGLANVLQRNRGPGPVRVDLTATRAWGSTQVWTDNLARPAPASPRDGIHR